MGVLAFDTLIAKEEFSIGIVPFLTLSSIWNLRLVSKQSNCAIRSNWKWLKITISYESEVVYLAAFAPRTVEEANRLFRYGLRFLITGEPGVTNRGKCHRCKLQLHGRKCSTQHCRARALFPCTKCSLFRLINRHHKSCRSRAGLVRKKKR